MAQLLMKRGPNTVTFRGMTFLDSSYNTRPSHDVVGRVEFTRLPGDEQTAFQPGMPAFCVKAITPSDDPYTGQPGMRLGPVIVPQLINSCFLTVAKHKQLTKPGSMSVGYENPALVRYLIDVAGGDIFYDIEEFTKRVVPLGIIRMVPPHHGIGKVMDQTKITVKGEVTDTMDVSFGKAEKGDHIYFALFKRRRYGFLMLPFVCKHKLAEVELRYLLNFSDKGELDVVQVDNPLLTVYEKIEDAGMKSPFAALLEAVVSKEAKKPVEWLANHPELKTCIEGIGLAHIYHFGQVLDTGADTNRFGIDPDISAFNHQYLYGGKTRLIDINLDFHHVGIMPIMGTTAGGLEVFSQLHSGLRKSLDPLMSFFSMNKPELGSGEMVGVPQAVVDEWQTRVATQKNLLSNEINEREELQFDATSEATLEEWGKFYLENLPALDRKAGAAYVEAVAALAAKMPAYLDARLKTVALLTSVETAMKKTFLPEEFSPEEIQNGEALLKDIKFATEKIWEEVIVSDGREKNIFEQWEFTDVTLVKDIPQDLLRPWFALAKFLKSLAFAGPPKPRQKPIETGPEGGTEVEEKEKFAAAQEASKKFVASARGNDSNEMTKHFNDARGLWYNYGGKFGKEVATFEILNALEQALTAARSSKASKRPAKATLVELTLSAMTDLRSYFPEVQAKLFDTPIGEFDKKVNRSKYTEDELAQIQPASVIDQSDINTVAILKMAIASLK